MKRDRRGTGVGWLIALGIVLVSLVVFAALLGPGRTARIAVASFLSTTVDGLAEAPGPHRLRVIDLRIDQGHLDTLNSDLPWSGDHNVPAMLVEHGVEYPVKFRYRGIYSASHYLGGKKSFRLTLGKDGPFGPYRRLNFINPKSFNMVNDHMGMWIAGRMGVAVPWNEMVFVRLNGEDYGVMEMYEQPDGRFEKNRRLTTDEVPVYRGEYPPITGRELTEKRTLWRKASNWQYVSDADSSLAHAHLQALVDVIYDSTLTLTQRRDTLGSLIDVDAYARYLAAMLVVNTKHMDQYHNQWLVMSERTGLFYPIFWDGLLMFPPEGEPLYFINDALAHWFLRIPEWRLLRDRYAFEGLRELHRSGAFLAEYDRTIERIKPSVLADRNKYGHVSLVPADVHRFSVAHVISSFAGMRSTVSGYWDRTLARLSDGKVAVVRSSTLRLTTANEAPLELRWRSFASTPPVVIVGADTLTTMRKEGGWSLMVHREVGLPEGSWDRPFANWQHYVVKPLDIELSFPGGVPAGLTITNAITDEAVDQAP
ncbi:MAG: CotH kinase family protein [Flavobacteriales bacterium]|nr:CotH kinase family protein [Flavobacteriales bacterium]